VTASPTRTQVDEAWRPLLAWGLGALFFCYAFVQRVSPSVMVTELMRDFGVGAAILGNLSAFYFYAYAGLQIPVGLLMDRIGPRRLMTGAAAVSAVGSVIFAASDALAGAYIGRLLVGAGAAFSWVGVLTVLTQWFPATRFALYTGLAQAFGMFGAIFGQAPVSVAVDAVGWRATLVAVGAIGMVLALLMWLVLRDKQHAAASSVSVGASLRVLLRNRETWLNAVFGLSMAAPMLGFGGLWAVPYLTTVYGVERATAATVISSIFIGWAIGAPLSGWLSDRIGARKPIMMTCATISAVSFIAVIYLPQLPLPVLAALIAVHGIAASGMVLAFACAREHNPPGMSSTAMALVNVAVVGSGAIFQPLIGFLLDLRWDGTLAEGARVYSADAYRFAFGALAFSCVAGVIAAVLMKESAPKR
jgi:MFS family permease